MRKASRDLWDLINSMNSIEQNEFKESRKDPNSNSVQLFNLIANNAAFQEDRDLIKELTDTTLKLKNFSRLKNYLKEAIYDFLFEECDLELSKIDLYEKLLLANALFNRNLIDLALKQVEIIKREAQSYFVYTLMYEALELEYKILLNSTIYEGKYPRIEAVNTEMEETLHQLHVEIELKELYQITKASVQHFYKPEKDKKYTSNVAVFTRLKNILTSSKGSEYGLKNQCKCLYLLGLQAKLQGEHKLAQEFFCESITAFQRYPNLQSIEPTLYLHSLSNGIDVMLAQQDIKQFERFLTHFSEFKQPSLSTQEIKKEIHFLIVLEIIKVGALHSDDFIETAQFLEQLFKSKTKWKLSIAKNIGAFQIAILFFQCGHFNLSRKYISQVSPVFQEDNELKLQITVIELLLALELSEWDLIESRWRSLKRYLQYDPCLTVFNKLTRLYKKQFDLNSVDFLELTELIAVHSHEPLLYNLIANMSFDLWIESKMSEQSLIELLGKRHPFNVTFNEIVSIV